MLFDTGDKAAAPPLWPPQRLGIDRIKFSRAAGLRRILYQLPTGGGKSRIMEVLTAEEVDDNSGVSIYTNRRMLMEQLIRDFDAAGISCGVRAADYTREPHHPVQICSVQTEHSRVVKRAATSGWDIHPSGLVLVDEAHVNNNRQCNSIIDRHLDAGATVVGFTATPVGLATRYDTLIQSGFTSDLRKCGALVPAAHFGCDEPDLKSIKSIKNPVAPGRDLTETEQVKAIMTPGIFGRVVDWYVRLNPHRRPTIGFAPGVGESMGFMEAFNRSGIPSAHIDGDEIIFPHDDCKAEPGGIRCQADSENRKKLARLSRTGKVKVVWNRFVMREGISWNWLEHMIFACVFGTLQSYLQSGGRGLRAYPGLTRVVVQDHGGNWWRHGSLNADREWSLEDTHTSIAGRRVDLFDPPDGSPPEPQPLLCRSCKQVLVVPRTSNGIVKCPACGADIDLRRKSRPVIQSDGSMIEMPGGPFVRRKVDNRPDTEKLWRSMYFRALKSKSKMTFRAAIGLFVHENGYRPPGTLPLMPLELIDWHRRVCDVKQSRLRQPAPKSPNTED